MRYELDNNGYVNKVFFGCMSGNCKEYRGSIPDGYGKNKIDVSKSTDEWINAEGGTGASSLSKTTDYTPIKSNQTYVFSYKYTTLASSGGRSICFYNTNKEVVAGGFAYEATAKKVTITPSVDGYVRITYDANAYDVQLEEGTVATDYEPYGGVVDGKNLFNIKNIPLAVVLVDDTSFKSQGLSGTLFDYDFKANTQYTISCIIKHNTAGYGQYIRVYYTDGTYTSLTTDKTENTYLKITTPSDKTVSNLTLRYSTYAIVTTISELQIEEGTTATSYEPYGSVPVNEESYNTALVNWATNANIQAYYLADGNLTYDANRDAELKALWSTQCQCIKDNLDGNSSFAINGDVLTCWGRVIITPTANTPTKVAVTFPKAFKTIPNVQTTPVSTVPGTAVLGASASNITTTGCDIYITRNNTTDTSVSWFAIGGIN